MAVSRHTVSCYQSEIIENNSRFSPNRVTYTGTASIPHCVPVMPIQTESAGSHSRKMRFAEIPVLFYLITPGCHSGEQEPLLETFTGPVQTGCTEEPRRTKWVPATSI